MIKETLIALSVLVLLPCVVHGSELLSEEALNYYNEGVKAQRMGDFYSAETSYQKTMIIDKSSKCKKSIFNNMGLMNLKRGEAARAEMAFKEALKLDPEYKTAASNLALLYLKLALSYKDRGNTIKALENFEKAFAYYPQKDFVIEGEKKAVDEEN
ncbi:hypothetical protein ACFL1D_00905 [Candidatus Omnitrophota bacterium]